MHGQGGQPRAVDGRRRHALGKGRAGLRPAGGADAPVRPVLGHLERGWWRKVVDLPGRKPDGHPGIRRTAACGAGRGTVVRDAVGDLAARKRAARVAPLPARPPAALLPAGPLAFLRRLRRRLRQPVARRRPAAAGTVEPEPALQLRDAPGLDGDRCAELGNHGIAVRERRRQVGDPAGQLSRIVDRSWHGRPACPVCCSRRGFSRLVRQACGTCSPDCQARSRWMRCRPGENLNSYAKSNKRRHTPVPL